jgi:hypothetical protein
VLVRVGEEYKGYNGPEGSQIAMVTTPTYHRVSPDYDLSSRFGFTLTGNGVPWRTSECAQLTF